MITDIITYLGFDGQCEAAFAHYEKILGGKIVRMLRYSDAPPGACPSQSPEIAKRIMHARMEVAGHVLMGADAPPEYATKPQGFSVNISVDDPAEAERIFHALAEGGTVKMPVGETFWAQRFGMLIDKFGTPWMINCEKKAA
jgi:PhnB protein